MIKSIGWALAFLCAGALSDVSIAGEPPSVAWHFVGAEALGQSHTNTTLNSVGALKSSANLAAQIRGTLTANLPAMVGLESRAMSADVIAPLVNDLFQRESAVHFTGEHPAKGPWTLAVRMDAAGADRWRSTLLTIGRRLILGEPAALKVDGLAGWEIPGKNAQRGFSFVTHNGWVLVASGFASNSTAGAWAKTLAAKGRPLAELTTEWLTVELQPDVVGWRHPLPFAGAVQRLSAAFSWQGNNVRTTAKLTLAEPVKPTPGEWRIPKGIARDPLVSFTAVRNLRQFFSGLEVLRGWDAGSVPDQWFGWSRGDLVFVADFAIPVKNSDAAFAHLDKSVPATYNPRLLDLALGQWLTVTNEVTAQPRLIWKGLPVFFPYVGPVDDGGQHFLHGGIFPLLESKTNLPPAAPAELWAQFEGRLDLLYYDWEITAARLVAYDQAAPFVGLFLPAAKPREHALAVPWLKEVGPQLDNVVTEIKSDSSHELLLTRRSQMGLTGFELWLLTHWLDSAQFPAFPYEGPKARQIGDHQSGSAAAPASAEP